MPGDQLPTSGDNPDISGRRLHHHAILVDEPCVARALLERRLPRQHVRQQSDRLDIDATPAIIRQCDYGNALLGESFIAYPVQRARRNHEARRYLRRRERVVTTRYAARYLQVNDAV